MGTTAAGGARSLPQHVWCWVAQYSCIPDFAALTQCGPRLLEDLEKEALWRHFAVLNGYVQLLTVDDSEWVYPFTPELSLEHILRWHSVVQANYRNAHQGSASVRFREMCLRVPVRPEETAGTLLRSIGKMFCRSFGGKEGVLGGGLRLSLSASVDASYLGRQMRLRRVQWCGRPGDELACDELLGGDGYQLMLEFALPSSKGWPLPPTDRWEPGIIEPTVSTSKHWPFNRRFLSPPFHVSADRTPAAASSRNSSPVRANSRSSSPSRPGKWPIREPWLLIRVKSSLLPTEVWVSVDGRAHVRALYAELQRILEKESATLAKTDRPLRLQLMSVENPRVAERSPPEKSLREHMWAQSETIRVELEDRMLRMLRAGANQSRCVAFTFAGDEGASGGGSTCTSSQGSSSPLMAYIIREQAFPWGANEVPVLAPQAEPRGRSGRCLSRDRSAGGWARQVSAPVPSGAIPLIQRQVSEPCPPMLRQISEACESALSTDVEAEVMGQEPEAPEEAQAHGNSEPRSTTTPLPRHPGDSLPTAEDSNRNSDREAASGEDAREPIAPHFPPVLLRSTLRVRQFEFHPSLPDVLLTGDKEGCVNAFDVESNVVHPPLSVGDCPMLALAWMKRHPQQAVCGVSHTGTIQFLKYCPNAPLTEPSLKCTIAVEDFPKLSSLSLNCSDDFLLASGISPDLAVYDVQTGKVLQRAFEAHDNFINISRFCNTSPHVFATASFDQACRVWDLRQPLTQARAVKTLHTGGRNVMCVFSPDDKFLLCSGVDTRLKQFEVPSWAQTPESFPLRQPLHEERYRRSTYLSNSRYIVTGATEESHLHVMNTQGVNLGVVNLRGVVSTTAEAQEFRREVSRQASPVRSASSFASRLESWRRASFFPTGPQASITALSRRGSCLSRHSGSGLVTGHVYMRDLESREGRGASEFIQSIRTHPTCRTRVGVLLAHMNGERSHVALVDLDPQRFG